jgi:hypothetical protein
LAKYVALFAPVFFQHKKKGAFSLNCAHIYNYMLIRAHFLNDAPVFYGTKKLNPGWVAGYAAIIDALELPMPMVSPVAMVEEKNRRCQTQQWLILPKSYLPEDDPVKSRTQALYHQLVFALKYEGVNLLVFAKLAEKLSTTELRELVDLQPTGQYARRIWFLLEWISGKKIEGKSDLVAKKSYVPLLDEKLQYAVKGVKSPRHGVINNLPGNRHFCPLVKKTVKLESHIRQRYDLVAEKTLSGSDRDLLRRATAYLMLRDSKASFSIEGESPKSQRAARWGAAVGMAGQRDPDRDELLRLQRLVLENTRFVRMGYRERGGFVGEHDRDTGSPLPVHLSARHQDLEDLMDGLFETFRLLVQDDYDPVLAAASIAFGFVFIHPFEDGNGRIHRYLIHQVLAQKRFADPGTVFPVSSVILARIDDYRRVLEHFSRPLLDWIEWQETPDHNVEVTNQTADYYRFFDATRQAEFLFDCLAETIQSAIPRELDYLSRYDAFQRSLTDNIGMPDKLVSLLIVFLGQNGGKLSKRAREKEFSLLTAAEADQIEALYQEIFVAADLPR